MSTRSELFTHRIMLETPSDEAAIIVQEDLCEWTVRRAVHGPSAINIGADRLILRYRGTRKLPEGFPIVFDEASGSICQPILIFLVEEYSGVGAQIFVSNTAHAYAHDLKSWFTFLEEFGIPWDEAQSANIDSFLEFMKGAISPTTGEVYAAETLNRRRMIVTKMYEFWRKDGSVEAKPRSLLAQESTAKKVKKTVSKPVQIFTPDMAKQLLDALGVEPEKWNREDPDKSSRDRLYGDIALQSGLRISEIKSLTASQFLSFSKVNVNPTELYKISVIRKGGLRKSVPIPGELILEILQYINGERAYIVGKFSDEDALIINSPSVKRFGGQRTSVRTIERIFSEACIKVGFYSLESRVRLTETIDGGLLREAVSAKIPRFVFHDLRHTFAVWTYYALKEMRREEPWMELADRLGHADPRTTIQIYLQGTKSFEGQVTDKVMKAIRMRSIGAY